MTKTKSFVCIIVILIISDYQLAAAKCTQCSSSNNVSEVLDFTVSSKDLNPFNSPTQHTTMKKWKVGRVSRKQYGIVNMLWRRTNIFIDEGSTMPRKENEDNVEGKSGVSLMNPLITAQQYVQKLFHTSTPRPISSSTTSIIEFYYLDESEVLNKDVTNTNKLGKQISEDNIPITHKAPLNFLVSRSPFFVFRINDAAYKRSLYPSTSSVIRRTQTKSSKHYSQSFQVKGSFSLSKPINLSLFQSHSLINNLSKKDGNEKTSMTDAVDSKHCDFTQLDFTMTVSSGPTNNGGEIKERENLFNEIVPLATNDNVKFFEMYDSNNISTRNLQNEDLFEEYYENSNKIKADTKITLEHINQNIGHDDNNTLTTKYSKKHIVTPEDKEKLQENNINTFKVPSETKLNTSFQLNLTSSTELIDSKLPELQSNETKNFDNCSNLSRHPGWSQYPFAAVYIYERSSIHCDAGVISSHWLVAAASCLSRHHDDSMGDGRTAFVAYCGDSWWKPERISYVKYIVIHPRYHPRDKIRRQLFNIGLIQVVTSMASACASYASIPIMSHLFVADSEGTTATAVGWGLDRYDMTFASSDLPNKPVSEYEGLIYSDSCPGNTGYRKSKLLNEEGVKNVYCLVLPPYSGEENDPVHGSLLLVHGKLIALYLKEERRQWGDQSAQYTGVWRLVPWVTDVAREPEEADYFM